MCVNVFNFDCIIYYFCFDLDFCIYRCGVEWYYQISFYMDLWIIQSFIFFFWNELKLVFC